MSSGMWHRALFRHIQLFRRILSLSSLALRALKHNVLQVLMPFHIPEHCNLKEGIMSLMNKIHILTCIFSKKHQQWVYMLECWRYSILSSECWVSSIVYCGQVVVFWWNFEVIRGWIERDNEDWIYVAEGSTQGLAVVNKVADFQGSIMAANCLLNLEVWAAQAGLCSTELI
jgi:hypothetical protein